MPSEDQAAQNAQVNEALSFWNQGDYVLDGQHWFAFGSLAEGVYQVEESSVRGFVVTTQTCDLVKDCAVRPWVEVSPLVEVSDEMLEQARQRQAIHLGYLPMLARRRLVADLERTMTFTKQVVAQWKREPSGLDDKFSRDFAQSLSRKRSRKAFPDDFNPLVGKMRDFIKSKHGKNSSEGQALLDLREIRVTAHPSWDAEAVKLTFWFIWEDWTVMSRESRASSAGRWCEKVKAGGRYSSVTHVGCLLTDMRADEYVFSDPLDLEYLCGPSD